jgi:hypothetical protein
MIGVMWQFKNGSLAPFDPLTLVPMLIDKLVYFMAWDRSLGMWVLYER